MLTDNHALAPLRERVERWLNEHGEVGAPERWFLEATLRFLGSPPVSVVLWNGESLGAPEELAVARLLVRSRRALYALLANPSLHFGDLYAEGELEVEGDLTGFLEAVDRARHAAGNGRLDELRRRFSTWTHPASENSLIGSREHVHHHYDLGNDFYRLWLDAPYMQYTCAYFPDPTLSLEAAQRRKLEHVCRKLRLRPGQRVVEAGSGWGGLALYMAEHYGVEVTSYNIAAEQVAYARAQAERRGLSDRVHFVEADYRNIGAGYDVFVSVGMLEHVGRDHLADFGEVIARALVPEGRGLVHAIGRNRPGAMDPWTEKRIFPGAYPPALHEMAEMLGTHNFSVLDVENLRLHYAKTLEHWRDRFEAHAEAVATQFDERFVRLWRVYLCGAIVAFRTSSLQLFQLVFTRAKNDALEWSREALYRDVGDA